MGQNINLTTADNAGIGAYRADPVGTPKGGIVVLQEIFGVNRHIRRVCDHFADQGYLAIAPALFDRVEPGLELGYDEAGMKRGIEVRGQVPLAGTLADIAAAIAVASEAGKVAVVGYCWGGSLAWLAAARLPSLSAAIGYYGGEIARRLDDVPTIPVILHFGEKDPHIPPSDIAKIRERHPEMSVFSYSADHGFNCDERASYDEASAALALERSLGFLEGKLGSGIGQK